MLTSAVLRFDTNVPWCSAVDGGQPYAAFARLRHSRQFFQLFLGAGSAAASAIRSFLNLQGMAYLGGTHPAYRYASAAGNS